MTKPQGPIPPAAHVLGTIGTVAGVFRIWTNWRRKSTEGLPTTMLTLWAGCAVPFGVYAIVQNFNFALKFQPQCFGALTLVCWGQTLYYGKQWRAWTSTLATVVMAISFAVIEAVLILTLRGPYNRGVEWPIMMMAIIASVMLGVGLIPPFFELAKRNGRVIGIDFIFLSVDFAGAFFSLMALVAQRTFDALGGGLYIVTLFLETGIFASQAIWLWRIRHVRRKAKQCGKTYDEFVSDCPEKEFGRRGSDTTDVESALDREMQKEEDGATGNVRQMS